MDRNDLYIKVVSLDEKGNENIRLFPSDKDALKISSYTYTSKRMGGAPTLTASVYASNPVVWDKGAFVEFLGERYYISYEPSMSKDNTTLMYKYDITFTSQREILDNTLFFDVVSEDASTQEKDKYRSNQTSFNFGGTIDEFVSRINSSLSYCGLYRPKEENVGYHVVIDEGYATDDVKEVSFENQFISNVLQMIYTTYGLSYYWVGKECHVGKQQHDLSVSGNYSQKYILRYGRDNELLSISKENANSKIVDAITGHGSSDNIPYYYPNDDEYGKAVFETTNFAKSLVKNIELGRVFSWNPNIYNNPLTFCKNKASEYSANVFGMAKYAVTEYASKVSGGNGGDAKSVIIPTKMGEDYKVNGSWSSSRLVSEDVVYFLFEFNGISHGSVNLEGLDITASEDEGQKKFGLTFKYEYSYYVGENIDIDTAINNIKNAGKGESANTGSGSFGPGGTPTSTPWAFGDNLKGLTNYTKSQGKTHVFDSSLKATVVIGCKVTADNIKVASGSKRMSSISISADGEITYTYKPKKYYFSYADGKDEPYEDSGIEISGIENIPCNETEFSFNGSDWVITTSDNAGAAKIHITDRIWILPSQYLMPSVYRTSAGAGRFYYAKNDTYTIPETKDFYKFANLYKEGNPHQGSVSFDDIKPTINGIRNDVIQKDGLGQLFGEVADVAFDSNDSDVKDSDNNYIHSYFYIKLHKFSGDYGFDLFKHALASESVKLNMIKSNGCPACSFEIGRVWSADANKCYNLVSTDGSGNLKSVSTDKNDYILDNDSAMADTLNQDTTQKEIWIAVKKENSTLGIVMPNASAGFKPQKGDLFVLTGIKPPKVLVTAAEKRLDEALIKYMSENNEDQFNYSVKFSRIYLQNNADFSGMLNENSKLSIHVDGEFTEDESELYHDLFVSEYSVKADENILCEVSVTLVNSLETAQSDTKNIVDAVKNDISQTNGFGNGSSSFNASITDKMYLSKQQADTARGRITFEQGLDSLGDVDVKGDERISGDEHIGGSLSVGQSAEIGKNLKVLGDVQSGDYDNAAEQGFSIGKEQNGKYHGYLTNLTVWGKAIFNELEIRKLSYAGGNIYLSGAGSRIVKAVPVKKGTVTDADGAIKVTWEACEETDSECVGWKCYLLADDGTTATMNWWQEGDQVRCQTTGEITSAGTYKDAANKSYWRTIPDGGVSLENEKIYGFKTETYVDADGNEQTRETMVELYDGQGFAWIVIGKHFPKFDGYSEDNAPSETRDTPSAGDSIVLDGNRHRDDSGEGGGAFDKTDRQNVIILETTGELAPRIVCFANISEYKHTVTMKVDGKDREVSLSTFETSPKGGTKIKSTTFEWTSDDGSTINLINYRGDWQEGATYRRNDQVSHDNALWVCVAPSGVDVTEEPSESSAYWHKILSGTDDQLNGQRRMLIEQSLDGYMAVGETETVTVSIVDGYLRDYTSDYTYKVERDTGDTASDSVWNSKPEHVNSGSQFEIGYDDLHINPKHSGISTLFYVTADDGKATPLTMPIEY